MDKILVIDEDKDVCSNLKKNLEKEGYSVIVQNDGDEALNTFNRLHPEMVILEVVMSGNTDGLKICKEIRKKFNTYIIFLTVKDELFDKVLGFELGADDYITKPFEMRELVERVKAGSRRIVSSHPPNEKLEVFYDNLHVDKSKYQLTVNNKTMKIPPKELELLFFLTSNPNRVYTRDQLLDEVWGFDYYGDSRTIDVHIKRLREKLDNASDKWALKTVWGVGYRFESEQK